MSYQQQPTTFDNSHLESKVPDTEVEVNQGLGGKDSMSKQPPMEKNVAPWESSSASSAAATTTTHTTQQVEQKHDLEGGGAAGLVGENLHHHTGLGDKVHALKDNLKRMFHFSDKVEEEVRAADAHALTRKAEEEQQQRTLHRTHEEVSNQPATKRHTETAQSPVDTTANLQQQQKPMEHHRTEQLGGQQFGQEQLGGQQFGQEQLGGQQFGQEQLGGQQHSQQFGQEQSHSLDQDLDSKLSQMTIGAQSQSGSEGQEFDNSMSRDEAIRKDFDTKIGASELHHVGSSERQAEEQRLVGEFAAEQAAQEAISQFGSSALNNTSTQQQQQQGQSFNWSPTDSLLNAEQTNTGFTSVPSAEEQGKSQFAHEFGQSADELNVPVAVPSLGNQQGQSDFVKEQGEVQFARDLGGDQDKSLWEQGEAGLGQQQQQSLFSQPLFGGEGQGLNRTDYGLEQTRLAQVGAGDSFDQAPQQYGQELDKSQSGHKQSTLGESSDEQRRIRSELEREQAGEDAAQQAKQQFGRALDENVNMPTTMLGGSSMSTSSAPFGEESRLQQEHRDYGTDQAGQDAAQQAKQQFGRALDENVGTPTTMLSSSAPFGEEHRLKAEHHHGPTSKQVGEQAEQKARLQFNNALDENLGNKFTAGSGVSSTSTNDEPMLTHEQLAMRGGGGSEYDSQALGSTGYVPQEQRELGEQVAEQAAKEAKSQFGSELDNTSTKTHDVFLGQSPVAPSSFDSLTGSNQPSLSTESFGGNVSSVPELSGSQQPAGWGFQEEQRQPHASLFPRSRSLIRHREQDEDYTTSASSSQHTRFNVIDAPAPTSLSADSQGVLVELKFISVNKQFASEFVPGQPAKSLVTGVVLESNNSEWQVGDHFKAVLPLTTVQQVTDLSEFSKLDSGEDVETSLGRPAEDQFSGIENWSRAFEKVNSGQENSLVLRL